MNPLTALPAKARLYLYAVLSLASLALTAWQASDGNWLVAVAGVVSALINLQAVANTSDTQVFNEGHRTELAELSHKIDVQTAAIKAVTAKSTVGRKSAAAKKV